MTQFIQVLSDFGYECKVEAPERRVDIFSLFYWVVYDYRPRGMVGCMIFAFMVLWIVDRFLLGREMRKMQISYVFGASPHGYIRANGRDLALMAAGGILGTLSGFFVVWIAYGRRDAVYFCVAMSLSVFLVVFPYFIVMKKQFLRAVQRMNER